MEKRPAEAENGDADGSAAKKAKKDPECGVLLFCGSTNWEAVSIFGFFIFESCHYFRFFHFFGSGQYFWFPHFRRRSVFSVFPFSKAVRTFGFSIFGSGGIFGFSI
jgi:hypothetical protein